MIVYDIQQLVVTLRLTVYTVSRWDNQLFLMSRFLSLNIIGQRACVLKDVKLFK